MIEAIFDSFPILETKRLLLKELVQEDTEVIYSMRSDERVNEFIARPQMKDAKEAEKLIQKSIDAFFAKKGVAWSGWVNHENILIGTCGFNHIDKLNNWAEIGGEMSTGHWGKKYGFEAVEAILRFGFKEMELHRIEAKVDPKNRSAIYLLENLGFVKEAHFRDYFHFQGAYHDLLVYGLLAHDFQ